MSEQLSGYKPMSELPGIEFKPVTLPMELEGNKDAIAEFIIQSANGQFGEGDLILVEKDQDYVNDIPRTWSIKRVLPTQHTDDKAHSQSIANGYIVNRDLLQVEDSNKYPLKPKYIPSSMSEINTEEVQNLLNRFKASKNGQGVSLEMFMRIFDGYELSPQVGEVFNYYSTTEYFAEAEVNIDYTAVTLPNNQFVIYKRVDVGEEAAEKYYVGEYEDSELVVGVIDGTLVLSQKHSIEEKIASARGLTLEEEECLVKLVPEASDSLAAIEAKRNEFFRKL